MTTRWEVERGLFVSDLSPQARLVALTLLAMTDAKNAVVPAEYTPSLTRLEKMTGLSLATVKRALNALEAAGWVIRKRPDPVKARTEKERTCYRLVVPGAGLTESRAWLSQSLGLGSERATSQTSSTRPLSQQQSTPPIDIVQEATGATPEEAAAIIKRLRNERQITSLPGFLKRLAADGDLTQFLVDHRAARSREAEAADTKLRQGMPQCYHGMVGGGAPHSHTGEIRCEKCRDVQETTQRRAS